MITPGQVAKGREDTRTSQDEQCCEPTTFSELYVSAESVANHYCVFGVKINPTIDRTSTHTKKGTNQHLPDDTPKVV